MAKEIIEEKFEIYPIYAIQDVKNKIEQWEKEGATNIELRPVMEFGEAYVIVVAFKE